MTLHPDPKPQRCTAAVIGGALFSFRLHWAKYGPTCWCDGLPCSVAVIGSRRAMMLKPRLRVAIAVAMVTTMLFGTIFTANAAVPTDTSGLREAVTADAIMDHLAELQKIADNNGGTRASGTPGYDASIDYIEDLLVAAGYEVTRQNFLFNSFRELSDPVFERVSPDPVTYEPRRGLLHCGVLGQRRCHGTTAGCRPRAARRARRPAPRTAAARQRTSPTSSPATSRWSSGAPATSRSRRHNAYDAGAVGVIIFNEGQEGPHGHPERHARRRFLPTPSRSSAPRSRSATSSPRCSRMARSSSTSRPRR